MKNFFNLKYAFILFLIIFFFVFSSSYLKYKISRLILSHELSILPNLIVKKISKREGIDLSQDKKKSTMILNQYVASHVMPIEINIDDGASWKLLHGSIWCDGVSDILNRLLEVINVRSYLVFLYADDGSSPHTLNMVDFEDQKLINDKNSSLDKKTLYLFDAQNNYNPINKDNKFVNINYMINHTDEFRDMKKLNSDNIELNLLKNNKGQLWDRNIFGNENSLLRNSSKIIVKYLPDFIFESLIRFAVYINPNISKKTKMYFYARIDHILLNYVSAKKKYKNLYQENIYKNESNFWLKNFEKLNKI